jgi:hypothetical protein
MAMHTSDEVALDLRAPVVRERPAHDMAGLPLLGLSLVALLGGTERLIWAGVSTAGTIPRLRALRGCLALDGLTVLAPGRARVVPLCVRSNGRIGPTGRGAAQTSGSVERFGFESGGRVDLDRRLVSPWPGS